MLGGLTWIVVTAVLGVSLLSRVSDVTAAGDISEPSSAQFVVAVMSAIIFGLPGVALVVAGWQRRRRRES